MEIREWSYEEYPEFTGPVEGAQVLDTTGDEQDIRYLHDVEYANVEGAALHLQILMPYSRNQPQRKLPCVVFVQGSAWFKQYVYMKVPAVARLAARGFVVAIVEYRGSETASFPAPIVDARNAVRFLRSNAEKFGILPDKMIIAGDSSGGHTAMYAGIYHDDDEASNLFPGVSGEVKGIVNYYGSVTAMLDDGFPSTVNHHRPDSPEGREMGGVDLYEHPELKAKLSVEENIHEDTEIAPVLIFHGTKDRTINPTQSVRLYRKLKETGKSAQLYLIKGADHGGAEFWTETVLDIVEKFIRGCIG